MKYTLAILPDGVAVVSSKVLSSAASKVVINFTTVTKVCFTANLHISFNYPCTSFLTRPFTSKYLPCNSLIYETSSTVRPQYNAPRCNADRL